MSMYGRCMYDEVRFVPTDDDVWLFVCMDVGCMYVCVCMYVYMFVMYVCMYVCMYVDLPLVLPAGHCLIIIILMVRGREMA